MFFSFVIWRLNSHDSFFFLLLAFKITGFTQFLDFIFVTRTLFTLWEFVDPSFFLFLANVAFIFLDQFWRSHSKLVMLWINSGCPKINPVCTPPQKKLYKAFHSFQTCRKSTRGLSESLAVLRSGTRPDLGRGRLGHRRSTFIIIIIIIITLKPR